MKARPPFEITPEVMALVARIERLLGQADASTAARPEPRLRKQNRIRTIKDSLAIEGNTLSLDQVSAIFDNKRVIGPAREILEVQNAIRAYEIASKWKAESEQDFRRAHGVLMKGLLANPGAYRSGAVAVLKGSKVSHVAPPAARLPELMGKLFQFVGDRKARLSPLVLSAVAHYEIEFIHPFEDGNGRMGRLWTHEILSDYHPAFEVVLFESLIKENQKEYYRVLEACDRSGSSTAFVEFSLNLLVEGVDALLAAAPRRRLTVEERLDRARAKFGARWFTRKEYMKLFAGASGPTASRDLAEAVEGLALSREGTLNKAKYKFR
jgi:Fic family protein